MSFFVSVSGCDCVVAALWSREACMLIVVFFNAVCVLKRAAVVAVVAAANRMTLARRLICARGKSCRM